MEFKGMYSYEFLPKEVKQENGIKPESVVKRLDCVAYTGERDYFKPIEGRHGIQFIYLSPKDKVISSHVKYFAEYNMTNRNINLGSIIVHQDYPQFAYSYHNSSPRLKNGQINPFYDKRNDLFLIKIGMNYSTLEIYVIQNGKEFKDELFQRFVNGEFDIELNEMKNSSMIFYQYKGR